MTIYEQFQYLKNCPSEINEHLEELYQMIIHKGNDENKNGMKLLAYLLLSFLLSIAKGHQIDSKFLKN